MHPASSVEWSSVLVRHYPPDDEGGEAEDREDCDERASLSAPDSLQSFKVGGAEFFVRPALGSGGYRHGSAQ